VHELVIKIELQLDIHICVVDLITLLISYYTQREWHNSKVCLHIQGFSSPRRMMTPLSTLSKPQNWYNFRLFTVECCDMNKP